MTCPHQHSDGAYVLGALGPAERGGYEAHLAECDECAGAVARLAPIPGLLGRVDPAVIRRPGDGPQPAPAPQPLTRVIHAVTTERRHRGRVRRWQFASSVLGSAVLAVAGTVAVLTALRDDRPGEPPPEPPAVMEPPATSAPEPRPMQPVLAGEAPVAAEVRLTETAAGTEVWMACSYPDPSQGDQARVFRLVAVGVDGSREQVGSWLAAPGDEVTMTGVTRFVGDELDRLELRGYHDRYLLTYQVS